MLSRVADCQQGTLLTNPDASKIAKVQVAEGTLYLYVSETDAKTELTGSQRVWAGFLTYRAVCLLNIR